MSNQTGLKQQHYNFGRSFGRHPFGYDFFSFFWLQRFPHEASISLRLVLDIFLCSREKIRHVFIHEIIRDRTQLHANESAIPWLQKPADVDSRSSAQNFLVRRRQNPSFTWSSTRLTGYVDAKTIKQTCLKNYVRPFNQLPLSYFYRNLLLILPQLLGWELGCSRQAHRRIGCEPCAAKPAPVYQPVSAKHSAYGLWQDAPW